MPRFSRFLLGAILVSAAACQCGLPLGIEGDGGLDDAGADSGSDGGGVDGGSTDASIDDGGSADAGSLSCVGAVDGVVCVGSTDPRMLERCFGGSCVGTYVLPPPYGDDSNPGTQRQPKATVAAAMTVADLFSGVSAVPRPVALIVGTSGGDAVAVYDGPLTVPADRDLQGGWNRDPRGAWSRNIATYKTTIGSASSPVVELRDGTSTPANTRLSGFTVIAPNSPAGNTTGVLVTNGSSPLLDELTVIGGAAPGGSSWAMVISGNAASAMSAPVISNSTLSAATADGSGSVGLLIRRGSPVITDSTIAGGKGATESFGLHCQECPGLTATRSSFLGGEAPTATGLGFEGPLTGIVLSNISAVGGPSAASTATGTRRGVNVFATGGFIASGGPLTISNSNISGVQGIAALAIGVDVGPVNVTITGSTIAGASPAGPKPGRADLAIGIRCHASSTCVLTANAEVFGARGVLAAGSAEAETTAVGVLFAGRGSLARNRLIGGGDCAAASFGPTSTGLSMTGIARVENNVFAGGTCANSVGVEYTAAAGGSGAAAFVNNHMDGLGRGWNGPISRSRGVVVYSSATVAGSFLNNTILAGGAPDRIAFAEFASNSEPTQVLNNNLFGAATLYLDEGTMHLGTTGAVNGLANAGGNISADPLVTNDFHLQAASPNRGAGSAGDGGVDAPVDDFDAQSRPNPAGSFPDIGPDEAP